MLLATRSILGLAVITSVLAGCSGTPAVKGSNGGSSGDAGSAPARTLSFAKPAAYANGDGKSASQLRAIDIDGDGHLDLALAVRNSAVGVMRNAGDGTFADATWADFATGQMTATDLNGDGRGDVIVTGSDGNLWAFHGAADGSLGKPIQIGTFVATDGPLMTADMDGDGVPEVISCSLYVVRIFSIEDPRNRQGGVEHLVDPPAMGMCAVGDVDANGRPDLVTGGKSDTLGVWLTDALGALPDADTTYANKINGQTPSGLFTADLNADGRADVISAFGGELLVRLAKDDGSLAEPLHVSSHLGSTDTPDQLTSLVFADLDGDGHLDAVMSNGGPIAILLGDGTGNLTQTNIDLGLLGANAVDLTLGDFDGDGLIDLAVANNTSTYVLRNTSR